MDITAFIGRDNAERVAFYKDNEPLNLTAAGANAVEFQAAGATVPAIITGAGSNEVEFKPGQLSARPGGYFGKIIIYTTEEPKGMVIAGPGMEVEILLTLNP